MASDVFFADQICYLNDINRAHAVCFNLLNAKKVLERTFHFQYRSQLQQESASINAALAAGKRMSDPDFPQFPYRIAHKLERSSNNLDIERMARRQSRTAVRAAELLQHDQFHDYKGNGRNGLESLRFETVVSSLVKSYLSNLCKVS